MGNGDIYVKTTFINETLYIPEGIYHAKHWRSLLEIVNILDEQQILYIEHPLKVTKYNNEEFIESFNFGSIQVGNCEHDNISELLKTEDLNNEEKSHIIKLCRNYRYFFKENTELTFINQVKHRITKTDDVPIYTKSYRYLQI